MKAKFFFQLFLFFWFSIIIKAQEKEAKDAFQKGNYFVALEKYNALIAKEKGNAEFLIRAGQCHLRLNLDKSKAVPVLEEASKLPYADPSVWYELGKAYHLTYKLDEAIAAFNKYKELSSDKDKDKVDRDIQMCKNAKMLIKNRLNVTFENLGKDINSPFPDYYPFIPTNEEFLVFTSRRKGVGGGEIEVDGYYNSDIYIAEAKGGEFIKAKNAGNVINTVYDEQASGLSPEGNYMLVYIDQVDYFGDLFISQKKSKSFLAATNLGENINTSEFESSGSISSDGNTLVYSSARSGGFGGRDIYISKKLPTGEWSLPLNLGKEINTNYHEEFPRIMDEGQTIYFSSQGHNSMGGYDIFKSTFNEESQVWSLPVNIGYPINTPEDNMNFCLSETGRYAYLSALRKEGQGDLDIYRVTFNNVDPSYTVLHGLLVNTDLTPISTDVNIYVTDKSNDEPYGSYHIADSKKGKYLISLSPGKYEVSIEADGYQPLTKDFTILDKTSYLPEIVLNIPLLKVGEKVLPAGAGKATPPKKAPVKPNAPK